MDETKTSADSSSPQHAESHLVGQSSNLTNLPANVKDWTKEDVRQWLLSTVRIHEKYAKILYEEEVSGAGLLLFDKKDLLDLGLRHGPAVQILKNVQRLENPSQDVKESSSLVMGPVGQTPETGSALAEVSQSSSTSKRTLLPREIPLSDPTALRQNADNLDGEKGQPSPVLFAPQRKGPRNPASEAGVERVENQQEQHEGSPSSPVHHNVESDLCLKQQPRPFDKKCATVTYIQKKVLPPETGPGNLIDPIHEYKLLANTANASEKEILKKFSSEVFRFAAACMNSRTNGTIHFGVGDGPDFKHGEVVGISVPSPQKYVDKFHKRLKQCFEKNSSIATACIRPPQFVPVQSPKNVSLEKWVIEVDIVPNYSETKDELFYTIEIKEEKKKEGEKERIVKCKNECLIFRQGAASVNVLEDKNPKSQLEKLRTLTDNVQTLALKRKSAEDGACPGKGPNHQGQRLRQLITHGRDTLENVLQFIVVTDKCHHSQLEHLNFLKELNLFAVLDFDPESKTNGTCSYFRNDRTANIHYPRMYNNSESTSSTIGKLNLFAQPSWVFCNGQTDEEDEVDAPLCPRDWHKKRAGEVSNMISFLCSPDMLSKDRLLVMFILHSGEIDNSSPILEVFHAIYKKLEGDDNMLCLCIDSAVFDQFRAMVQSRCEMDITSKCIYELNLNEINCTIMKIKEPQTQSCKRYLPSSGSSSVLLTQKEAGRMTVLDILCENECEDTEIERMKESFVDFKNKTEEEFYRGGQVTWWNFYLSERPGSLPFIKRDKYEDLNKLITPVEGYTFSCVIIKLFHHPGCGGTTLAMHMLWNLRSKFRCAVLKNNTAQCSEIAVQVTQLLTYGKEDQSNYTPVLLLVDNWEDVEDLQRSILTTAREKKKQDSLMVIILNCERSQSPPSSSGNSKIESVYLTNKLSKREQDFFHEKLKELEGIHERPETFYAFMIMTKDFSAKYIENLVCNTLKDLDVTSKQGQLLSFLALLNTYVNGSGMSVSCCEALVGIQNLWLRETLEDVMSPYSTLLIRFNVEELGTYQAFRFLHQMIAEYCLKLLISMHDLKLSEIATNLLHCDLLYKSRMGKDVLAQNIMSMLITRHKKELGDEKNTLFSPLIEEMPLTESKDVLVSATKRFDKNATVPQALARHFYLKENNFIAALQWAQDAQQKGNNSYIADTLGQVYKSHLKHEIEHCKELTPEMLDNYLQLAFRATKAFRESQELAKKVEPMDYLEQRNKKMQKTYNTSGYVGEMDVAMIIFDFLKGIFKKRDGYQWHKMLQLFKSCSSLSLSRATGNKAEDDFICVLSKHEHFLFSLKPRVKEIFEFFENYFTYLKDRSIERETAKDRHKRKVSEHFEKYVKLFCLSEEQKETERAGQPNLSLQLKVEESRCYLVGKRADTFAGLLTCLNEKSGHEFEDIFKKWQFIFQNSTKKRLIDRVNFILANIVLYCIKPKSTLVKKNEELVSLLNEGLQEAGTHSDNTEIYHLSMLLLWPRRENTEENMVMSKNICTYVASSKKSFHRRFSHMFPVKSAIAHFYLAKPRGSWRVVHKAKLERGLSPEKRSNPHQLWQSGAIWKEGEVKNLLERVKGKTENGNIYVHYPGNIRILVRPVYLGGLRSGCSTEEVSFFLGFTMEGPVAYDIKYTCDM